MRVDDRAVPGDRGAVPQPGAKLTDPSSANGANKPNELDRSSGSSDFGRRS